MRYYSVLVADTVRVSSISIALLVVLIRCILRSKMWLKDLQWWLGKMPVGMLACLTTTCPDLTTTSTSISAKPLLEQVQAANHHANAVIQRYLVFEVESHQVQR